MVKGMPTEKGEVMARKVFQVRRGCTFCGTCVTVCPHKAIDFTEKGAAIDPAACVGCGVCADNCASEAIVPVETERRPGRAGSG